MVWSSLLLEASIDMISFTQLGIRHVYIRSGESSKRELDERGLLDERAFDPIKDACFVELSWGSDEEFDFAVNTTGSTIDEAIAESAIFFYELVQRAEANEQERYNHGVWGVWMKYKDSLIDWIVDSQNKVYKDSNESIQNAIP